jgi:hypothetical protein
MGYKYLLASRKSISPKLLAYLRALRKLAHGQGKKVSKILAYTEAPRN